MIEKQEFYHGAAILRLIEDPRCLRVRKRECGYAVNDDTFVFVKYSTKAASPWRFTVTEDDVTRIHEIARSAKTNLVVLICGGDGICATTWENIRSVLGDRAGWVSAKRNFNGSYTVAGPLGALKRKVPLNQWPSILFDAAPGRLDAYANVTVGTRDHH